MNLDLNENNCTICKNVSICNTNLEVDFSLSFGHTQAQHGSIKASVTLPKDEELVLGEVWELGKETLKGFVIIISDLRQEHLTHF